MAEKKCSSWHQLTAQQWDMRNGRHSRKIGYMADSSPPGNLVLICWKMWISYSRCLHQVAKCKHRNHNNTQAIQWSFGSWPEMVIFCCPHGHKSLYPRVKLQNKTDHIMHNTCFFKIIYTGSKQILFPMETFKIVIVVDIQTCYNISSLVPATPAFCFFMTQTHWQ
jgi:hypothetical protein